MRMKALKSFAGEKAEAPATNGNIKAGSEFDAISDARGKAYEARGLAVPVDDPRAEAPRLRRGRIPEDLEDDGDGPTETSSRRGGKTGRGKSASSSRRDPARDE